MMRHVYLLQAFFIRWRRILGVIILVMTLILWSAWVRSIICQDVLMLFVGRYTSIIFSANGAVSWTIKEEAADEFDEEKGIDVGTSNRPISWAWISRPITVENGNEIHATTAFGDPSFVSYAPVVISLTAISAVLILWKPRKQEATDRRSSIWKK